MARSSSEIYPTLHEINRANPNYRRIRFIRHFNVGRHYKFPLCCIIRFSIGVLFREGPQSAKRGGRYLDPGKRAFDDPQGRYVVCGIFHKPDKL